MKILYVAEAIEGSRALQRFRAINKLYSNAELFLYENNQHGINGGGTLAYKISFKLRRPLEFNSVNKRLTAAIQLLKPDVIFFEKCLAIHPKTYALAKDQGIVNVAIFEDDVCLKHNSSIYLDRSFKYFDFVFTTKEKNVSQELYMRGVKRSFVVVPSYCDKVFPLLDTRNEPTRFKYDVSFIGTFESDRASYVMSLMQNGIPVHIWGNGWDKLIHPMLFIHPALYENDYREIIFNSKINLCFLRKKNRDSITSRSIEIPASGGFMLAEDTNRHRDIFGNDSVAYFTNKHELLSQVQYFLANEELRKKMALLGNQVIIDKNLRHEDLFKYIITVICK
jgi:spore maturation protein CgeB